MNCTVSLPTAEGLWWVLDPKTWRTYLSTIKPVIKSEVLNLRKPRARIEEGPLIFTAGEPAADDLVINQMLVMIYCRQFVVFLVLLRQGLFRNSWLCSETTITGESRFHISTPLGIWTWVPCDGKQIGSPLDQWDMVTMKWDCRLSTVGTLCSTFDSL